MASETYPKVTAKAWLLLRKRAVDAPSVKFTPEMVAALLEMSSPKSALYNTINPMRRLGLINEEGALTHRGNKWRVDSSFDEACQEILDEVYSEELRALTDDDGNPDRAKIKNWFDMKGFGNSNADQMTNTYVMIASKAIPELAIPDSGKTKKVQPKRAKTKLDPQSKVAESLTPAVNDLLLPPQPAVQPALHLDIQIHVPADATPEQIDLIFSSMARHLYAK
ncbi:MAG: DUF5343 domain-containing protein [Acidimicrobiaceae bacterium]|nr:DUF5343 domain-containing protein [Acidimicrobiaceae bacterium]